MASPEMDRETYCANLEARVTALRHRIEEVERAEEAERVNTPGHPPSDTLKDLQARHDDLSRSLARCQFIEEDDWINARDEAESAFARVENALETATARYRGRGSGGS
ncbi:hypothetical protein [Caenispirillum salinarum]|uniref:hypothetical protein n=1 Tax=Caenispirillum salinarum TaxID=859058 RepID=UPI00384D719D